MKDKGRAAARSSVTIAVTVILSVIMAAMLLAGCSQNKAAYVHIEPDEAKEMIESGECILVDTRGEPQYDYEHIPGAINVPVDAEDDFITEALPDKSAKILLYCDYGGLSKQMGDRMAADLGYTNLYEFDGLLVWEGELDGTASETNE